MKIRHIAFGVVAAVFLSAPAVAQNLWENLNGGMSIEEVRAVQPTATPVSDPNELVINTTYGLRLSDYQFGGVSFEAVFFFRDSKLVQVNLTAKGKPAHADYDNIVALVRAKHGRETSGGKTAIGYRTSWEDAGGLNIGINYLTELGRRLLISFQVRTPS